VDLIVKRAKLGKNYGTLLIPEGTIEFFPDIGVLINEINEIQAKEENPTKSKVAELLSEKSRENFNFLPVSIQD
jgi:pyrophosphate--fructose-6-phosphate 1-phosphotransferase